MKRIGSSPVAEIWPFEIRHGCIRTPFSGKGRP